MTFSGQTARKRFGQHWLKDDSVLENIISAADIRPNDRVLEIGPGRGALTEKLLISKPEWVHAIELDRDLVDGLKKRFCNESRFSLKEGDALSVNLLPPDGKPLNKVVANIPYNITGPLLERFLGRLGTPPENKFQRLVLLLQKEVAERIVAMPGKSNFSALSIRLRFLARSKKICAVKPSAFSPPPKVDSMVLSLEPLREEELLNPVIAQKVDVLLKTAFLGRRKMLRNTLRSLTFFKDIEASAAAAGISLSKRPQELHPEAWLILAGGFNYSLEAG